MQTTTPMTSMAMLCAAAHSLSTPPASVNGRRIKARTAMIWKAVRQQKPRGGRLMIVRTRIEPTRSSSQKTVTMSRLKPSCWKGVR